MRMDTSSVIAGRSVRCTEEHMQRYPDSKPIELPLCFTKPEIPIDEDEIPTPSRLRQWNHLHPIISMIPDYDPSIPVAILIGGNCAEALDPYDNIHSVNKGP